MNGVLSAFYQEIHWADNTSFFIPFLLLLLVYFYVSRLLSLLFRSSFDSREVFQS